MGFSSSKSFEEGLACGCLVKEAVEFNSNVNAEDERKRSEDLQAAEQECRRSWKLYTQVVKKDETDEWIHIYMKK